MSCPYLDSIFLQAASLNSTGSEIPTISVQLTATPVAEEDGPGQLAVGSAAGTLTYAPPQRNGGIVPWWAPASLYGELDYAAGRRSGPISVQIIAPNINMIPERGNYTLVVASEADDPLATVGPLAPTCVTGPGTRSVTLTATGSMTGTEPGHGGFEWVPGFFSVIVSTKLLAVRAPFVAVGLHAEA
jgi:hypothetical protein